MTGRRVEMTLAEAVAQDKLWVHGERLEELDRSHLANLVPFLRRNAERIQLQASVKAMQTWGAEEDMSDGVYSAYADDVARYFNTAPEDWLEQTPLMRRLVEMERADRRSLLWYKALAARNKAYELLTGYRKVGAR